MRILNIEPRGYSPKARSELELLGEVVELEASREDLLRLIPGFDVLITRLGHRIDAEVLARAERLEAVVTATTGLSHVDLEAAETHGVEVLSLRGEVSFLENVTATAELAWGLIICSLRAIPRAHGHVMSGGWDRDLFKGAELKNKTLGVVGLGRLGKIVASYAKAFRMAVLAADPRAASAPDGVELLPLEHLLPRADVVTLHVNLVPETRGFFGAREFGLMKTGSVFVNTSRGELVDEAALLEALRSGQVGAAGLDVLDGEASGRPGWLQQHPLRQYAAAGGNLIITPHMGGATSESMEDTEVFMSQKLARWLRGRS